LGLSARFPWVGKPHTHPELAVGRLKDDARRLEGRLNADQGFCLSGDRLIARLEATNRHASSVGSIRQFEMTPTLLDFEQLAACPMTWLPSLILPLAAMGSAMERLWRRNLQHLA
jgi:hypothetical protein